METLRNAVETLWVARPLSKQHVDVDLSGLPALQGARESVRAVAEHLVLANASPGGALQDEPPRRPRSRSPRGVA